MDEHQVLKIQIGDYDAFVHTEGKTDWKYLEKAKEKLKVELNLRFYKKEESIGDRNLLQHCKTLSKSIYPQEKPLIFIFDRDNLGVVREVEEEKKTFKCWGNNVFSFAIPVPSHRAGHENLSLEFYFSDKEIRTQDSNSRRLFLSSEFNEISGRHLEDHNVSYGNNHTLKGVTNPNKAKIIDSDVFNETSINIALSKSDFAENIYRGVPAFAGFDFAAFKEIFAVIRSILLEVKTFVDEEDSNVIPIHRAALEDRIYRDSPPVVSIFVGRDTELNKLNDSLIRVAAITGLGGEGKSTLAAKHFERALVGETTIRFRHYGWCDCKDLETPFHQKLLTLLEDLTEGAESKEKYAEENVKNTIKRFSFFLNNNPCLVVFDNIDAFVDKEACTFTGYVKTLFNHITTSLSNSLVIFTCRPQINDHHFSFMELPIGGLSYNETVELSQNFGILGTKVDETDLTKIHDVTKGHALWLNLIFAQIRNERLAADKLQNILASDVGLVDRDLLRSIWKNLSNNEKELIWTLSTFTRPPGIETILRTVEMTYQKCNRIIRSLIRLRMIVEICAEGETLYDLHPIIRMKAKDECKPQKRKYLLDKVIVILSFGNWKRLSTLIMHNDHYSAEIDRYVQCAEIAVENREFEKALEYVRNVSDGLLKYGEDAKNIELATGLLNIANYESYQIGIHRTLTSVYKDLIKVYLEQGEFEKVESYLSDYNQSSETIQQYIFYAELMGYSLWFRNDFVKSTEFIESAIEHIQNKGEIVPEGMRYDYALALRDSGNVDKALEFFLSKIDMAEINAWDPESGKNIAADAGNISRCLYLKGELKESLALCKKSIQYLKRGRSRQDRVNYGYGLLWVADIYIKQKNYVEAKGYLEEATAIWKKYCPSRIHKIRDHLSLYPVEIRKVIPKLF